MRGPHPIGMQWSNTALWLGSSHPENGWRGGQSGSFLAELAEYLRMDTLVSSNVKAGINGTNSHRFSLTPALSLLGFFYISPGPASSHPDSTLDCLGQACQTPGLFGPCQTLESCAGSCSTTDDLPSSSVRSHTGLQSLSGNPSGAS